MEGGLCSVRNPDIVYEDKDEHRDRVPPNCDPYRTRKYLSRLLLNGQQSYCRTCEVVRGIGIFETVDHASPPGVIHLSTIHVSPLPALPRQVWPTHFIRVMRLAIVALPFKTSLPASINAGVASVKILTSIRRGSERS